MSGQRDLSIIIVNWNSAAFVRKCLTSLYAHTKGVEFEVLVVENASYDGCDEVVREFPEVRFIQNSENTGFAQANNLGFTHSWGRNLLFLNPDTEVVGAAIAKMLSILESTPDAGIVGARLLNSDLSVQTSCIQKFPTILNQILDAECLRTVFPRSRLWGTTALFEDSGQPVAVEAISGACMMTRRSVFKEVGFFSTDYFMYTEDIDLCHKVQRAGWKTYYVAAATVIHHGGRSADSKPQSSFGTLMMRESVLKFLQMRRGKFYAAGYRWTMALVAVVRVLLLGLRLVMTLGKSRRNSLSQALAKWLRVFRWAGGGERWVKDRALAALRREQKVHMGYGQKATEGEAGESSFIRRV